MRVEGNDKGDKEINLIDKRCKHVLRHENGKFENKQYMEGIHQHEEWDQRKPKPDLPNHLFNSTVLPLKYCMEVKLG